MDFARILDHLSDAPKTELFFWGSTVGIFAFSALQSRSQLARARSKAGNIKAGSTGPRIWTPLLISGQLGGMTIPSLVYWTTTAYNKFRQPEWLTKYALPPPPDVFGVDGVVVGRGVGLLALLTGIIFTRKAAETLGDQFNPIGVSTGSGIIGKWLTYLPGS
jgi:hypothetical protein